MEAGNIFAKQQIIFAYKEERVMGTFTEKQLKDIDYFKSNLAEFLGNALLANKYVVISGEKIQNSFDTIENAVNYSIDNFQVGDYIIQRIVDPDNVINFVKAAIV